MTAVMVIYVVAVAVLITGGCAQYFFPSFRTWLVGPPAAPKAIFDHEP